MVTKNLQLHPRVSRFQSECFLGHSYALSSPYLEATYSGVLGYYMTYLGSEYADIIEVIYQGPTYVNDIKDQQ